MGGLRLPGKTKHFTGSGGAILGVCPDQETFARLQHDLGAIGCRVIAPTVLPSA